MTTFAEARTIVEDALAPTYVAPYGHEHPDAWRIIAGPREWIIDRDPRFFDPDGLVILVRRSDGRIVLAGYNQVRRLLDTMRRVGEWPADD